MDDAADGRIQREIESSRDYLEYAKQYEEALSPRFGFSLLNSLLFPVAVTTTTTVVIPVSYTFTTSSTTRTVSYCKNLGFESE